MKNKINLKKGDLLICLVLLGVCGVFFLLIPRGEKPCAKVSIEGKTVYSAYLSEIAAEQEIALENGVVIGIAPGEIYFKDSPCKGKDCVKWGRLTRAGQCAVCLPRKTLIVITGTDENAHDGMVY